MEQVRNEQTIYSAAVYCRLSKDDEQAGESVSIETQKMMLTDFCHERGFSIYEIYADDGYSGLNFNRPAFTRLLEDIDNGKINLVITKDLSRLGRDYIQTGYYTDVYFSRKRIRYIAVNDGIDTNRDDNDIAPFKNILNDMYAKDLSRKVKSAKRQRAYKGYYISAQAPYGYKVDPLNRNRLIVDEEAAEVVKEIFRLALAGHSLSQISRILSQRKIITPGVYKAQNGDTVARYSYDAWGKCTVISDTSGCSIATINPYRYRGYYYDVETSLYYLQSRYYDVGVGRFLNADEIEFVTIEKKVICTNLFIYCKNNAITNIDALGFWAERYPNFSWQKNGFNLDVHLNFLSRPFCISYAADIIRLKGQWYWWGKGYKKMDAIRIAQELWFHALVYYVGSPIKSILNTLGVSWSLLNGIIVSASYMQINNDDDRAWIFSLAWWSAYTIKTLIRLRLGYRYPYAYIHI